MQETTSNSANPSDDFDLDLDDLLAESMAVAAAKKAKATGRRLSPDQEAALAAERAAVAANAWHTQAHFTHVDHNHCSACDTVTIASISFYQYQTSAGGKIRRLVLGERPATLGKVFETIRRRELCASCFTDHLPAQAAEATLHDCDLLDELGQTIGSYFA